MLLYLQLGWAAGLAAQGDCFPPKDSHEAQTFGILSVPLAFSPAGAPGGPGPSSLRFGLEATYLPRVDAVTATPTVCRPGKGPEHVNILPGFLRLRLAARLPAGVVLEAGWIPPLRVRQVEANLVSLAVGRVLSGGRIALALRLHATVGVVHAPITCDEAALLDPASECFAGTRSNDSYHPNIVGADLQAGRALGDRFRIFGSVGYNRLYPRFRVDFTNQFGVTDRRRVEVNLGRLVLAAGGSLRLGTGLTASAEIYGAPADAVTGRLVIRKTLGGST